MGDGKLITIISMTVSGINVYVYSPNTPYK